MFAGFTSLDTVVFCSGGSVQPWHLLVAGGVFALIGLGLLWAARRADWKNWIIEEATPLPIRLVNPRDDVWVHGKAACESAQVVTHFGHTCLHYTYKLEERVRRTRRTKDGKTETYYTWVTRQQDSGSADFAIVDADHRLTIQSARATFDGLTHQSDRQGRWRHSCSYFPYPAEPSAIGSVSEDKQFLEPYEEIPLIVTTRTREQYIEHIERGEGVQRWLGFIFLTLGVLLLAYGLLCYTWSHHGEAAWHGPTAAGAAGAAVLVVVLIWVMYTYNTLVTYRIRTDTAFRQIDVDLKNRYDLIPNLVAVVKGYMQHERELLEQIAATRARALGADRDQLVTLETEAAGEMQQLTVVVEAYPDLKANQQFQFLFGQLEALEEKIAFGRHFYNDAVTEYNTCLETFPKVIVARLFGFQPFTRFAVEADERAVPQTDVS